MSKLITKTQRLKEDYANQIYELMVKGIGYKDIFSIAGQLTNNKGKTLTTKQIVDIIQKANQKFLQIVDSEEISKAKELAVMDELYKYCVAEKKLDLALKVRKEIHAIKGLTNKEKKVQNNTVHYNKFEGMSTEDLQKMTIDMKKVTLDG